MQKERALCVLSSQEMAIIVTQYFPMTLSQLANILSQPPLNVKVL